MTSGSVPRHLIAFSVPMLAGNAIQTAYSIVNAVWVGKFLGEANLAAVTISFPIVFLLFAVAGGLTIGTSILVSQFAGAREWDRLRKVVQTSTVLIVCVSVLSLVVGQMLAPWIVRHMHAAPDIRPLAADYLRIYLYSIPAVFGMFLAAAMLRGMGDSKTPLYFLSAALVGTAILDPILIFGLIGFPRLGLNGTAIASVAMQTASLVCMYIYLYRKDHTAAPDWRHLTVDWPTLWLTFEIGLPSVVQQSLVSLGMLFVVSIVSGFRENATAAFGAAMRIDQIAFLPALTFGGAVSTLTGQNIGAGRIERVKEVFRWGTIICGGITLAMAIVAVTTPHILLRAFLSDPQALRIGIHYLRIMGISYVCYAVMFVSNGVINGAGYTFVTTIMTLVALWAARVPLAYYLSNRMHRVEGVFIAMAASSVLSMLISLGCYLSGFWKTPLVRHRPLPEPADPIEPFPSTE